MIDTIGSIIGFTLFLGCAIALPRIKEKKPNIKRTECIMETIEVKEDIE